MIHIHKIIHLALIRWTALYCSPWLIILKVHILLHIHRQCNLRCLTMYWSEADLSLTLTDHLLPMLVTDTLLPAGHTQLLSCGDTHVPPLHCLRWVFSSLELLPCIVLTYKQCFKHCIIYYALYNASVSTWLICIVATTISLQRSF